MSSAPNRRAVRPARGGGGRTAPATKAFFLRMPGRSAANPMRQCTNAKTVTESFVRVYSLVALQCGGGRATESVTGLFVRTPGRSAANRMRQCANAKTVTTSFVRVYPLVALQCGPARKRYRCVTRRQLNRYAMSWRQQAPRPIQCRSCTGSVSFRGVLRPSRLPERNRHAGDFWRPNACLMTVWGQGEPDSSRKRRAKGALAIVLARDRSLGAIERERACTASRATTGAQLGSG